MFNVSKIEYKKFIKDLNLTSICPKYGQGADSGLAINSADL